MTIRIALILLIAAFIVSANEPALSAPESCGAADWEALGRSDGALGVGNAFDARARVCPATGESRANYRLGFAAGVWDYCSTNGGFRAGLRNIAYSGGCPPNREAAFLFGYREGLEKWSMAHGYDGYWFDGNYVRHAGPDAVESDLTARAPMPRVLLWGEENFTWDEQAGLKRARAGERDWRELWSRTPAAPPSELPPPVAVPPKPAPDAGTWERDAGGIVWIPRWSRKPWKHHRPHKRDRKDYRVPRDTRPDGRRDEPECGRDCVVKRR